jgi:hypothetical protein
VTLSSAAQSSGDRGFVSNNVKSEAFSSIRDYSNSGLEKKEIEQEIQEANVSASHLNIKD